MGDRSVGDRLKLKGLKQVLGKSDPIQSWFKSLAEPSRVQWKFKGSFKESAFLLVSKSFVPGEELLFSVGGGGSLIDRGPRNRKFHTVSHLLRHVSRA